MKRAYWGSFQYCKYPKKFMKAGSSKYRIWAKKWRYSGLARHCTNSSSALRRVAIEGSDAGEALSSPILSV